MSNQVFINPQNILECRVIGDQTVESVEAMGRKIEALLGELKAQHRPLIMIDDITQMGNVPPEARNVVVSLGKTLTYDRIAMVGKKGILLLGANLIIRATGRGRKLKYFSDHNAALKWLGELVK